MQTVMEVAMKSAVFRQSTKLKALEVAKAPQKPTAKVVTAKLRQEQFTLAFDYHINRVQKFEGIQIGYARGGIGTSHGIPKEVIRHETAKVDLRNLMDRVSVDNISVVPGVNKKWCRVYINCTVTSTKDVGFNEWGKSNDGVYEKFITKALLHSTWSTAVLREFEGKTSLSLSIATAEFPKVKIQFAIAQPKEGV